MDPPHAEVENNLNAEVGNNLNALLKWWGITRTLIPGCRPTSTHGWNARRICECIGIDEISHKRRHRYLTAWLTTTGPARVRCDGWGEATLQGFFDLLGPDRAAEITHVSAEAPT